MLAVAGLALLGLMAGVRHTGLWRFHPFTSVHMMKYDVRTASGAPLTSIFEGVVGSRLDAEVVSQLLAEAKAPPRDPCRKKAESSWSKLWEVFAPASVLAQGSCVSGCTGHYNREFQVPGSDCEGIIVCAPGGPWASGCEGTEYQCPNGGSACGQAICSNP